MLNVQFIYYFLFRFEKIPDSIEDFLGGVPSNFDLASVISAISYFDISKIENSTRRMLSESPFCAGSLETNVMKSSLRYSILLDTFSVFNFSSDFLRSSFRSLS